MHGAGEGPSGAPGPRTSPGTPQWRLCIKRQQFWGGNRTAGIALLIPGATRSPEIRHIVSDPPSAAASPGPVERGGEPGRRPFGGVGGVDPGRPGDGLPRHSRSGFRGTSSHGSGIASCAGGGGTVS